MTKKERNLAYYYANKERILQERKTYYKANREKVRQYVAKYQWTKKIEAVNKLGGKCERCGFDHPAALQFHHRDPTQKLFTIDTKSLAKPKLYPPDVIEAELAKCELLCANCHFIHHATGLNHEDEV